MLCEYSFFSLFVFVLNQFSGIRSSCGGTDWLTDIYSCFLWFLIMFLTVLVWMAKCCICGSSLCTLLSNFRTVCLFLATFIDFMSVPTLQSFFLFLKCTQVMWPQTTWATVEKNNCCHIVHMQVQAMTKRGGFLHSVCTVVAAASVAQRNTHLKNLTGSSCVKKWKRQ